MTLAVDDINFLQKLLADRTGHVLNDAQSYLLDSRLKSLVSAQGFETVEQLVAKTRASNSPLLQDQIAEAMTINETFFFRDMHPFEALQETIIPQLIESRRQTQTINIWAGACSSGQEPYSIAIVLREHFPELMDWNIKILATDISDEILARAKSGEYSQFEVNRGMPAKLLIRHFDRNGSTWTVKNEIRKLIEFRKVNLTKSWFFADMFDIVFLRNVLIYFSVENKQRILEQVHRSLASDGCLFLGGGESIIRLDVPFDRETNGQTSWYQPVPSRKMKK